MIFLCEIIEALDELFSEKIFILLKPIFLTTKGCCFNILYFEFNGFRGYGRYVNVKIVTHKIIITNY